VVAGAVAWWWPGRSFGDEEPPAVLRPALVRRTELVSGQAPRLYIRVAGEPAQHPDFPNDGDRTRYQSGTRAALLGEIGRLDGLDAASPSSGYG
jgi:hypothetical protein